MTVEREENGASRDRRFRSRRFETGVRKGAVSRLFNAKEPPRWPTN